MQRPAIQLPEGEIADLCRRHHIVKLALFGSVLRDDFGPNSDVDVLVEFETDKTPGLTFFAIQDELSELIGHPIELDTPAGLSPYFRDEVLRTAEVVYVAP